MRLTRLIVRDVRNLQAIDWQPAQGLNILVGPNGSGKTSLLEAIHLAAVGRSFRTRDSAQAIRRGCKELAIGAWFTHSDGRVQHIRLRRDGEGTRIQSDDRELRTASELARSLPVLALSQDGVARFRSSRGERRAVLDWGLFHVEQGFHAQWSRFNVALQQRNAALRSGQPTEPWLAPLVTAGEAITASRVAYLHRLQARVGELSTRLELDFAISVSLHTGWRDGQDLRALWHSSEDRDRSLGYTSAGPHRADLILRVDQKLGLENLSSGQVKLIYLVLRLAQLDDLMSVEPTREPIIFFDDLAAELDGRHLDAVLRVFGDHQLQRFVTSPSGTRELGVSHATVFHVEHGAFTAAATRDVHD
jgi:DNA replication and repair protein RecF